LGAGVPAGKLGSGRTGWLEKTLARGRVIPVLEGDATTMARDAAARENLARELEAIQRAGLEWALGG